MIRKRIFGALNWDRNSCYQDSVFTALFATRDDYIISQILKSGGDGNVKCNNVNAQHRFRNAVLEVIEYIRNPSRHTTELTVKNIRQQLKFCQSKIANFQNGGMQDSVEFLKHLLYLFNIESADVVYETPNYVNHQKMSVVDILAYQIRSNSGRKLSHFLHKFYDAPSSFNVLRAKFLVLALRRLDYDSVIYNELIPNRYIRINRRTLYLTSIVLYQNKHYTTLVNIRGIWYFFNDREKHRKIERVGKFDKLRTFSPSPYTNGVLFFYTREC